MGRLRFLWFVCLFFLFLCANDAVRNVPVQLPSEALLTPQAQPALLAPSPRVPMQLLQEDPHHHLKKVLIWAITSASVGVIVLAMLVLCAWIYRYRHFTDTNPKFRHVSGPALRRFNSLKASASKASTPVIEYALLELATDNFSEENILGEGGSGCVYKARLNDCLPVAVKRLESGGRECDREFENEIDMLGRLKHQNIVSLMGYCEHAEARFIIYELMQNGSLETKLHGPSHGSNLSWHIRMKIALDTARGLEYLHEHCNPPVIHRDLKSSNILLDSEFNAKISDFGLSVINGSPSKSLVKLSGTVGYVAPEYLLDGKLTEKSDVYAFGVVLLELLTGRRPVEKLAPSQCQSIVTWVMPQLIDRSKLPNIIDPAIRNTMDLKHLYQVAAVAVLCIQREPSYRPLITDVLHSLIPLVPLELGGALRFP